MKHLNLISYLNVINVRLSKVVVKKTLFVWKLKMVSQPTERYIFKVLLPYINLAFQINSISSNFRCH